MEEGTVKKICRKVQEVLMREANIEYLSSPINLVGDVHGQFYDVQKLLAIGMDESTKPAALRISDTFL